MPEEKQTKTSCVDDLRHAEYYCMQKTFDDLYFRSQAGEVFTDLMDTVLQRENILLAYRNIKTNTGGKTAGTDGLTIKDIGRLPPEEVVDRVRYIVAGKKNGYTPKPVRRKDIPKTSDPTKTRPLGIPCIWDRLVQQCFKQVLEPICEAKFSENSYGFRPQRRVEHAISRAHKLMQRSNLHYVVEFDIKGFFDNVHHVKLIRQMWALGIQDKRLLGKIKRILKAPIRMPDGTLTYPDKGTPQGGIISPLLANIVLNELDQWVDSQWERNPIIQKYSTGLNNNGSINYSNGYRAMKTTGLKEMRIVRYADDFRVFCRTRTDAEKTKIAITKWLAERLKLEVSPEKTRVVNVKRRYSEFLGFKIKVHPRRNKFVVKSHICDKQLMKAKQDLCQQAKNVARPIQGKTEYAEIRLYNSMVMGKQGYYRIATEISPDCMSINRAVMTIFTNRLKSQKASRLLKHGRKLTGAEARLYGKSKMMRYVAGSGEPIYPIGYVQFAKPMGKERSINCYTVEGRAKIHDNLRINVYLMQKLMRQALHNRSIEYADNRISLFSAQWGRCFVSGRPFQNPEEIHCHHKKPVSKGGTDEYGNLVLMAEDIHKLLHAEKPETIRAYLSACDLSPEQMEKLNDLREMAGMSRIA